jgi:hypothetical protein
MTHVSWAPRRELVASEWLRHGRWLGSLGRAVGWWIGDWLRYGNASYGERYTAAARITGYDRQTLMNMVYVASRIDISRRREILSFSHHAEVASLRAAEQEQWLERAEREGLSVRSLREAVRQGSRRDRRQLAAHNAARGELLPPASHPRNPPKACVTNPAEAVCPECGYRFAVGSTRGRGAPGMPERSSLSRD